MGEEGVICWERGVYYQDRLTAQSKATIVPFHHDPAQNNAASSSSRNPLATFVKIWVLSLISAMMSAISPS